jgi:2-hydroxy-6-oxonona-2,4-dienedioate hydrolase
MFPSDAPLRFAGFSFGGAIAAHLAARLGQRVTHLCLISPGGFPPRTYAARPTRSYKEAGDNEALFRDICRHNLLVNMLSYAESVTADTLDLQAYCVRHTRFNSRKVSGGGTLLDDLAKITCRLRLLWGEGDNAPFRPAADLIAQIREVINPLDLHRIPRAGHWAAYENAPVVNRLLIEFFTT